MPVQIVGRSSSLFTRMVLIFARELGVAVELTVVPDMTQVDTASYQGNPALKLPSLRRADGGLLLGTENICRALAELAPGRLDIVWPEALTADLSRTAQELVWHAMAAQVQWVMGTQIGKLPADNLYFAKGRAGFVGALAWLDANLAAVLALLPARELSLFEVSLFCLLDHLAFRDTLAMDPYPALTGFARAWGQRASAMDTVYRFD